MAGDWLKMELATPDKPEVMRIAGALCLDRDLVLGKLFRLWAWFDQHTSDGNAVGVTPSLLDALLGVTGFCDAVNAVNWIAPYEGGIRLVNFDRHNGQTAKTRALTAKRVADHKKRNGNDSLTMHALPREEKRRDNPIPLSGAFLKFWGAWPKSSRKQSRGSCWERWRKQDFDLVADQIIAHVEAMKLSMDWRKDSGAFIPAPLVYLNQKRWEGAEASAAEKRMVI